MESLKNTKKYIYSKKIKGESANAIS